MVVAPLSFGELGVLLSSVCCSVVEAVDLSSSVLALAEEAALAADDLMSSFLLPRVLALRRGGMVLLFAVFFS